MDIILILLIIIAVFLIWYKFESTKIIDSLEGFDLKLWSDTIHKKNKNDNVRYIFWTGGFDSTFRICQMLHDNFAEYDIQPLYIIDQKVDGLNGGRRNRRKEIKTMNFLRSEMKKAFPFSFDRLRPTLYIDKIDHNYRRDYFDSNMKKLIDTGIATRLHTQYRAMAIHTLKNDIIAEVGTEGRDSGAMTKHLLPFLYRGYYLQHEPDELKIFYNIRWPLSLYKKSDMYEIAKKEGYSHILKSTFSCWFPVNDKPCGECKMCTERLKLI